MTNEERFGQQIQQLRQTRGLSVRKAASLVGISHWRLAELERGRSRATNSPTRASRDTVLRLAAAYGEPADPLLELAGYARQHRDLNEQDQLLLDLFHTLDEHRRTMVIRVVKAIGES